MFFAAFPCYNDYSKLHGFTVYKNDNPNAIPPDMHYRYNKIEPQLMDIITPIIDGNGIIHHEITHGGHTANSNLRWMYASALSFHVFVDSINRIAYTTINKSRNISTRPTGTYKTDLSDSKYDQLLVLIAIESF